MEKKKKKMIALFLIFFFKQKKKKKALIMWIYHLKLDHELKWINKCRNKRLFKFRNNREQIKAITMLFFSPC